MVNITARQWILKPLFAVKYGPGAVILPPPPAPRLTSITLSYPQRSNVKPGHKTAGTRIFLRECLPRFKYYNPGVKIDVKTPGNMRSNCMVTLEFEGTDPEALKALATKSSRTKQEMPVRKPRRTDQEAEPTEDDTLPTPPSIETKHRPSASDDEVVLKPQPPANPNAPSTVTSPLPIYMRTVTLATNHRPEWEIAKWLERTSRGTRAKMTEADQAFIRSWAKKKEIADKTREVMKGVTAKIKEEQAALSKAKKAADAAAQGEV